MQLFEKRKEGQRAVLEAAAESGPIPEENIHICDSSILLPAFTLSNCFCVVRVCIS
jgi:hypothetical protein